MLFQFLFLVELFIISDFHGNRPIYFWFLGIRPSSVLICTWYTDVDCSSYQVVKRTIFLNMLTMCAFVTSNTNKNRRRFNSPKTKNIQVSKYFYLYTRTINWLSLDVLMDRRLFVFLGSYLGCLNTDKHIRQSKLLLAAQLHILYQNKKYYIIYQSNCFLL